MGYRLMAWDGDFRTKDMFRASGREHANFAQKKAAHEAAERFMRTFPPRSDDARVILEKTSSRWGSTTEARWGKGPSGWTKTSGDPRRRRRTRRDCIGVHTHENMGRRMQLRRDPEGRSASEWAQEMARLRTEKPRPLHKRYGSNPTPSQIETHKNEEREWNRRYRYASKMQKKQLVLDNEEYRRRQTSGDARRTRLTRSQQAFVHRKIRILRREHPRWSQKQVVAVAISYARRRGR